jgi:hypothetical protein
MDKAIGNVNAIVDSRIEDANVTLFLVLSLEGSHSMDWIQRVRTNSGKCNCVEC